MTYRLLSFIAGVLTLACFYFTFIVSIWLGLSLTMPDVIAAEFDPMPGYPDAIAMSGDIEHGDAAKFQRVLDYRDSRGLSTRYLMLESYGGYIVPAADMADIIVARQIETVAGTTCVSSCFLLWAAGSTRWYWPTSNIGVHSASMDANAPGVGEADVMVATQVMAKLYAKLGVPSVIIGKMVATPNDAMTWLTPADVDGWAWDATPTVAAAPANPGTSPSTGYAMTCSGDIGQYTVALQSGGILVNQRWMAIDENHTNAKTQAWVVKGPTRYGTYQAVFGGPNPRIVFNNGKETVTDRCW